MRCYRRLPVDGMYNARELGGFPTADGSITNYRQFIRCEVPKSVTREGLDFLRDYGVCTSVDLRGERELLRIPSKLAGEPWVEYLHAPVFNGQVAAGSGVRTPDRFVKWPELYISMVDGHMEWIRSVFELFAAKSGVIMFNCTTGKDRTGIIAALLLSLAGVPAGDIVADYCVSEVYMRPVYMELFKTMPASVDPDGKLSELGPDDPFFKTTPENMALLLEHLDGEYGGVRQYLMRCGVSDAALGELRRRLTGK